MFKKIEIWILYLVIFFSVIFTIFFGVLVRQELVGSIKVGWASKAALFLAEIPVNLKKIFQDTVIIQRNGALFSNKFEGKVNNYESFLILTRNNGDEGIVELIDLTNFKVLHTWNPDIDKMNSNLLNQEEFKYIFRDRNNKRFIPRHPLFLENGDLLIHHFSPLRKIDSCSNLIFENSTDMFHHTIEEDDEGFIWIPSYLYPQKIDIKKIGKNIVDENGYIEDAIVKISPNGEIVFEKSVSEILIENNLEHLLFGLGKFDRDPTHLNDIQPVKKNTKYWKKGDLFLSLRHQSMVFLYRPSTNKIIWKSVGKHFQQHDVNIIDDKKISIFNNNSKFFFNSNQVEKFNEILIYDFEKRKYESYLKKSFEKYKIDTLTGGRGKILPNGDLFVIESDSGNLFYFNADGTLRWGYTNQNHGQVYAMGWSRLIHSQNEIDKVNKFLKNKGKCDDKI